MFVYKKPCRTYILLHTVLLVLQALVIEIPLLSTYHNRVRVCNLLRAVLNMNIFYNAGI